MDKLNFTLKIILANTTVLMYKAQSYHWNCTGSNFSDCHSFFKGIYDDLFESIDIIAEQIRINDQTPPMSLKDLLYFSTISEDDLIPSTIDKMYVSFRVDNETHIDSLNKLAEIADSEKKYALLDIATKFLAAHEKLNWMLKSKIEPDTLQHVTI